MACCAFLRVDMRRSAHISFVESVLMRSHHVSHARFLAMTHAPDERPPDRADIIALTAVRSEEVLRGESPVMRLLKGLLARIGASPASTVLITGESGTGKDGAAKIIHSLSARRQFPFVNITCSALPEALLESELF